MARIAVVSFRLGGTDGVSIEAAKWIQALEVLGHKVTQVAGQGPADVILPGLAIDADTAPTLVELHRALDAAQLVIVENLCSLPLNVAAREQLYQALDGRPALFRHHDLPWQRAQLAHLEGPRDQLPWRHVTINERSRHQLGQRGIAATTMMNCFDCDPPPGDRAGTRLDLGLDEELLVLMPTRALPRKNVEGALSLATSLGAVLWLLGPAEDGYASTLESLLASTTIDVRLGLTPGRTVHDAYAACDLVVMPSTWEGFGNPVLESVTHRRPLCVYPYPVLHEITSTGLRFFDLDDVHGVKHFFESPDESLLEMNLAIARRHFNVRDLPRQLATVLELDARVVRDADSATRNT
jgi:glycosyltransferase involved in cell wall biosynthesis